MPAATIEIRRPYSRAEESALISAVQAAMTAALRVPQRTTLVRLLVHEAHRFLGPPDKGERYTLVTIDCFIGRSSETKRRLYQAIVENLGRCGIPADHLKILLREAPRENWAIGGGSPASELVLDYEVNV